MAVYSVCLNAPVYLYMCIYTNVLCIGVIVYWECSVKVFIRVHMLKVHTIRKATYPANQPTNHPHLCPILSLCFFRAFSAISCEANCTKASPVLLPWMSTGNVIPFGTISNPSTQGQISGGHIKSHAQSHRERSLSLQKGRENLWQTLHIIRHTRWALTLLSFGVEGKKRMRG